LDHRDWFRDDHVTTDRPMSFVSGNLVGASVDKEIVFVEVAKL
jgi:hypothetical protein